MKYHAKNIRIFVLYVINRVIIEIFIEDNMDIIDLNFNLLCLKKLNLISHFEYGHKSSPMIFFLFDEFQSTHPPFVFIFLKLKQWLVKKCKIEISLNKNAMGEDFFSYECISLDSIFLA
jgi:hypothetical protein